MFQTKSFCLRIAIFCTDHNKTHTNRYIYIYIYIYIYNRRFLAQIARMQLLFNHWHINCGIWWKMLPLILHAIQKVVMCGQWNFVQITTIHITTEGKKPRVASSNNKDAIVSEPPAQFGQGDCTTDCIVSIYQNKVHLIYHISEERTLGPILHCFSLSAGDLCACHTVLVIPRIQSCVLFTSYYSFLSYNFPT